MFEIVNLFSSDIFDSKMEVSNIEMYDDFNDYISLYIYNDHVIRFYENVLSPEGEGKMFLT